MTNDLIAKQNVLSWGADVRLDLRQHIDLKDFLTREGGVAFICTLAGVALAAWFGSDFAQRNKGALGGAT